MTIKDYSPRPTIDLSGPEGNVFFLLGFAARLAKQLERDGAAIQKEMKSGNYNNAVAVFDREFGDFVDLVLPKNLDIETIRRDYLAAHATPEVLQEGYLK